jgi:KDO2-lipid IV(A) lauroyltransferase
MKKKIRHIIEAILVNSLFEVFKLVPIKLSSAIFGSFGKNFGKFFGISKVAKKNITKAFPEKTDEEVNSILLQMWENLGRTAGEFPHMSKYNGDDIRKIVDIEGEEYFDEVNNYGKSVILFSGHFANFEVIPKVVYNFCVKDLHIVYRKSNNSYLDKLILKIRSNYQDGAIPKGSAGARMIIKAIKQNKRIGMLVDQKQNDGLSVPFFGRQAMTASAIANLALRYDCLIVPVQAERVKGVKFKVKVHKPYKFENTGDESKDIYNAMLKVNRTLEGWIRQKPSNWFWIHNRWPKSEK